MSDATRQLLFVRPAVSTAASGAGRVSVSSDASLDCLSVDEPHNSTAPSSAYTAAHRPDKRLSSDSALSELSAASPLPPAAVTSTDTAASADVGLSLAPLSEAEWSALPLHLRSGASLHDVNAQMAAVSRHCVRDDDDDDDSGRGVLSVDSLLMAAADSERATQLSGKQLLLILARLQRVANRGQGRYTVLR